jgi:hypothetical protein
MANGTIAASQLEMLTQSGTGIITIVPPATNTNRTLTLPNATGTVALNGTTLVASTAVASTSGTSIDFTSIPSWVKRVTVILQGISTNGSSAYLVRLGTSSGVVTSGYVSSGSQLNPSSGSTSSTAGILLIVDSSGYICTGNIVFNNIANSTWVASYSIGLSGVANGSAIGGGHINLGASLDRVRITTVNGTDTFDAGSINILYE